MLKENGRSKKLNYPEVAKSLMRVFKCTCGETASFKSIQFGETVTCTNCEKEMTEEVQE